MEAVLQHNQDTLLQALQQLRLSIQDMTKALAQMHGKSMGGASSGLDLGGALSDDGTALHKMALVNQRMIFQAVETFLQNCSVYFPLSGVVCLLQGPDTSLVR